MSELTHKNVMEAIRKLQVMRASVTSAIYLLEGGTVCTVKHGSYGLDEEEESSLEENDNKYFLSLKEKFVKINRTYADLDKSLIALQPLALPFTSGSISILASDPMLDQSHLSQQVMQTYRWFSKMHEQSFLVYTILMQNITKKSSYSSTVKRNKKLITSGYNHPFQQLEPFFARLRKQNPDVTVTALSTTGPHPFCLEVTVGQVLRALLMVRGIVVENVVIKAYNEEFKKKETGKYLHDSLSKYEDFRTINERAKCILNHGGSPEVVFGQFLFWLGSYKNLFTTPCSKCGKHLADFCLPIIREPKTQESCHASCYS